VSNNVNSRWNTHKNKQTNVYLKNAINKYGWDNLVKKVVLTGEEDYCLEIEFKLRSEDRIGWNLVKGGGKPPSALGKKFGAKSLETKQKISLAKKGFKNKPEVQARINIILTEAGIKTRFKKGCVSPLKGKKQLPHVIEAIRKGNLGRVQSVEEKAKRTKSMIGHVVTEETRQKISQANKNAPKLKCSHCDKTGHFGPMKRWHMDNCRFKEIQ
jgi:ribosomal protein L44E